MKAITASESVVSYLSYSIFWILDLFNNLELN